MDLVSETFVVFWVFLEHFICFIENKHFDFFEIEVSLLNHIKDSAGSATDHMNSHFQFTDVFLHGLTSETGMNLNVKMIAECKGYFLGLFSELASR